MRGLVFGILVSWVVFVLYLLLSPEIAHTAIITVVNLDDAGDGFNDPNPPDPASTIGGNNGTNLGAQRLIAFQRAATIWGSHLLSPVVIRISARLNPLTCNASSATLGSAGTSSVHRDFPGALLQTTWYPQALANSRFGGDLSPDTNDVTAQFNSAIGTTCPFPLVWYYGLDGNPPAGTLDFVSVVLHELGHGLGFQSFVNLTTGARLANLNDVFSLHLEDHITGKLYSQMTDAERISASQNNGNLHWIGANVMAASSTLTGGANLAGHVQMYAPTSQSAGSSVSHFDTAVTPNETMEPFYTGAKHDVGLTLELLADLGWVIRLLEPADNDFDGDGKSDIAIYRDGTWFILRSSDGGASATEWGGLPQDLPVPGDYDGDGQVDIALYRGGGWFVLRSSDGGVTVVGFGGLAPDIPVPADYDGDGRSDIALYRSGEWFILRSSDGGVTAVGFGGLAEDLPLPGDYEGDGKADIALYRDGGWFILRSSDGGQTVVGFGGLPGDIPVPADYDGDGLADIAIYRGGGWFILRSSDGLVASVGFGGLAQDIPVPADYDGDAKTDIAVYRDGLWFIRRSSDGVQTAVGWGGLAEDIPLN